MAISGTMGHALVKSTGMNGINAKDIIYTIKPSFMYTLIIILSVYFGLSIPVGLLCKLITGQWPDPPDEPNPYPGPPYWGDPFGY